MGIIAIQYLHLFEDFYFETSDISSAVSNELGKSTSSQLILRESFLVKQKNYIGLA